MSAENHTNAIERLRKLPVLHDLATKCGPGQHMRGDYVMNADGTKACAPDCRGCPQKDALAAVDDLYQAAKIAHDELDDAIKANVNDEWDQSDYDRWNAARDALAAAVHRVNGE